MRNEYVNSCNYRFVIRCHSWTLGRWEKVRCRMRLIDADALKEHLSSYCGMFTDEGFMVRLEAVLGGIDFQPTVDAVEVVHGEWERCSGDLHSSGYAVYCSVCNKIHFVHNTYSLGGLYGHKELFELPNYCPNCGAKMDGKKVE